MINYGIEQNCLAEVDIDGAFTVEGLEIFLKSHQGYKDEKGVYFRVVDKETGARYEIKYLGNEKGLISNIMKR